MLDSHVGLGAQLTALMTGLADQKIKDGEIFVYDGGRLFADDVTEIALPCALVLADSIARHLGMGDSGYEFELGSPNPVFPVHAEFVRPRAFMQVAPFLTEVFERVVYPLRNDLAQVYALAANQMGLILEDGIEPAEVDAMPVVAAAVMENHGALMGAGALSLGR
ncbi:hypothetical protein [Achromobacter insolitus]|uniref:hypothetical protein n=1 Tax=Achromobacter insolitus TaxID=217204 RepID=UPI0007C587DD|nr:hypothetical protein [Achromobacter insolitus]